MMHVDSISQTVQAPSHHRRGQTTTNAFAHALDGALAKAQVSPKSHPQAKPVYLGTISEATPTVSHLLISNPIYGSDCWRIVHAEVNKDKAFGNMRQGQQVYLNPTTQELIWEKAPTVSTSHHSGDVASPTTPAKSAHTSNNDSPQPSARSSSSTSAQSAPSRPDGEKLTRILKTYIGTPYHQLDCYELVVAGLKQIGVAYGGGNGLQADMMREAADKQLPSNAYLTGDGLITYTADKVYGQVFNTVPHPEQTAADVADALETQLESGMIFSVWAGNQGHTGVISRHGDTWTLINSGQIDNAISSSRRRKGVGEESLRAELNNWFQRAHDQKVPLHIRIGRLSEAKLSGYMKHPPGRARV